ncbi:MAG TPA: hypothetical protein VHT27_01055 [Solirubrobacteraceae bacterium]|jgi:hypothetical protein|nr:hypothetical protein [Solirubrobacteraceae bacterium]
MLISSRLTRTAASLLTLACASLVPAAVAGAAEGAPATVTVRVEGPSSTLLPATTVTTNSAPVVKDGNSADSCAGTSAAGALELATKGSWSGNWYSGLGYSVETIEGQAFPFTQPFYWTFWLDNKPSTIGICEAQLSSGDSILFFPECFSETAGECPAPANPLAIEGPASAETGMPVTFSVLSYPNAGGAAAPGTGATVSDPGEHSSAATDSAGRASLTFATAGVHTVDVSAPGSVRSETTICVHAGNDGTCGTTAPAAPEAGVAPSTARKPYTGPFAVVATVAGAAEGHAYAPAQAPRLLAGTVLAHTSVSSVSLELRRRYKGRCWAFAAKSARFERAPCGSGTPFPVATGASFSYLLPSALKPGRYVLDVLATDAAGNHTALARGSTRIVFYVR